MNTHKTNIQTLVECAILVAVGAVLSQLRLFRMPNGGEVTVVSMLPFILVSFRHGNKWGLLAGITNSALQMLLGGVFIPPAGTALAMAGAVLLDYILGFSLLGTASAFSRFVSRKYTMLSVGFGTFAVCFIRFLCSFVSGFLIWSSLLEEGFGAVVFSLGYNASYMIPETAITLVAMLALFKKAPALFRHQHEPLGSDDGQKR